MLKTQPDFQIAAEASDGQEAVQLTLKHNPDIVLLDLEMPILDGVEALRTLRRERPSVKVLVFTAFDSDERILGAVQAGAQGYLLKGAPREEVFNAIRVVSQGGSLLQPVIASKLMQHVAEDRISEDLTEREMEVLNLLAKGYTNREIAEQLVITERTVKFHVSSILRKLDAGNRTEAVSIAAQQGLVNL